MFNGRNHGKPSVSALEEPLYFSIMMFLASPSYGLRLTRRWKRVVVTGYVLGLMIMALFLVILARMVL